MVQFLNNHSDEDIEAFLPEDVSEADDWINGHVQAFLDNEEPTAEDMVDGMGAIFMMAFLEQLYDACGVQTDDDEEGDGEPDEDDEDEQ